ncbi:MAG TPA: DUF3137 domain-containing protein, partial [Vicinamibacteria bacterium]|nr:DUF3137 domain-containing protein [Vicinamibacteria bacterium]
FAVYASDPIEARYVLTPKTMERIVGLARTFGRRLYAAFDHRRVYLLLDNGRGAFEALAFGGEKAWDEIRGFAALFDAARAIVEELELNTRIWTKGFAPEAEAQAAASSEPSAWTRVAKMGAWAFQGSRASVRFTVDDPPAPPARARIERRAGGGFYAGFPATWGAPFVLFVVLVTLGFVSIAPAWWTAHPELDTLARLAQLVREWSGPVVLLGASMSAAALYRLTTRVRAVEAGGGNLRIGRVGPARLFPSPRVQRIFAAEDLVMAQIQGSWIPVLLSPRLGGHGAALWLAAEIESALSGGSR